MFNQNFIFSEKRSSRIRRHLLFWFALAIYFALLQAANPFLKPSSPYLSNLPSALARSFLMLVPQTFAAYSILYFVVPFYIKKRQLLVALVCLIAIWIGSAAITIQMSANINPHILNWLLPTKYYRDMPPPPKLNFLMRLLNVTKGVFTGAGFLVMLHYIKHWYMKEQRNLQLQKENAESQLQLLTAQVHPHFLFNTLNNIYSQTQTESSRGSKMIMELSDMLRYILAEGRKELVPLQKELAMIQDYINLEKVRYGNKLDMHISIPENTGNLHIAPLLLLPFLENCFKHGASKFLNAPWINLKIEINDRQLSMKLMNGKDVSYQDKQPRSGTGINNVKKRLELLYPNKHRLEITDEPEVFVVNLCLELTDAKPVSPTITESVTSPMATGYTQFSERSYF